jgi:hypothetical protein
MSEVRIREDGLHEILPSPESMARPIGLSALAEVYVIHTNCDPGDENDFNDAA